MLLSCLIGFAWLHDKKSYCLWETKCSGCLVFPIVSFNLIAHPKSLITNTKSQVKHIGRLTKTFWILKRIPTEMMAQQLQQQFLLAITSMLLMLEILELLYQRLEKVLHSHLCCQTTVWVLEQSSFLHINFSNWSYSSIRLLLQTGIYICKYIPVWGYKYFLITVGLTKKWHQGNGMLDQLFLGTDQ